MAVNQSRMSAKKLFLYLIFVLSLVLAGCARQQSYKCSARPFEESEHVKLMSFNIRYGLADDGKNSWPSRSELVFDAICRYRADVVGLQEALRFQIDQVRRAMPEYSEIGLAREDGKKQGEYCSILYRRDRFKVDDKETFWFSNSPWVPGSIHWGNACTRICTWARLIDKKTGKAFYVYNLHLDHVSQPSRERSVHLLAKKINAREHNDPYVVMGDFNAGEDNKAVHYLRGWGDIKSPVVMMDTYRVIHPFEENVGTFHGFEGKKDSEKIDYIFAEMRTKVLGANIMRYHQQKRYPSDHFPVTAELDLLDK